MDDKKPEKEAFKITEENILKQFRQVRKEVETMRKACDTMLDAAEKALKMLTEE